MKKSSILLLVFIIGLISAQQRPAVKPQPLPKKSEPTVSSGKLYGSIFSDYLYILQEPQFINPAAGTSGRNEFTTRRATLGYEHNFSKDVSAKIEYDASGVGLLQAYANIKNLISSLDMKMGKMQNTSAETIEKIWEYRSLNVFVLERNGLLHEFDEGITLTGRTDAQGTSYAQIGAFNGSGLSAESDKLKKVSFTVGNWFDRSSIAEIYVDYENVGFGRSTINAKLFYGMKVQAFAFGAEAFYRMNRKFAGTTDITPAGGSLFGWFEMMKGVRGIIRADVIDNDLNASNIGLREIYVNAGIDYSPVPEVHLIPNILYTKQLKKGSTAVNADIMAVRLTAAVTFPSFK